MGIGDWVREGWPESVPKPSLWRVVGLYLFMVSTTVTWVAAMILFLLGGSKPWLLLLPCLGLAVDSLMGRSLAFRSGYSRALQFCDVSVHAHEEEVERRYGPSVAEVVDEMAHRAIATARAVSPQYTQDYVTSRLVARARHDEHKRIIVPDDVSSLLDDGGDEPER